MIRCAPIETVFGACVWTIHWSSRRGNPRGWTETSGRESNQLTNRLREQLHRFHVQAPSCVPRLTSPACGTCSSWRLRLKPRAVCVPKRVERLLPGHRIRRVSPQQLLAVLGAPAPQLADGVVEPPPNISACCCHAFVWSTAKSALRRASGGFADQLQATPDQALSTATSRSSGLCQEWEDS